MSKELYQVTATHVVSSISYADQKQVTIHEKCFRPSRIFFWARYCTGSFDLSIPLIPRRFSQWAMKSNFFFSPVHDVHIRNETLDLSFFPACPSSPWRMSDFLVGCFQKRPVSSQLLTFSIS